METENKESSQETVQDVDFIQENVQERVPKPLVSIPSLVTKFQLTTWASSGVSSS